MVDIGEIKRRLESQVESVARHLLPAGKLEGREWVAGSVHGEEGRSLKVCVSGSKLGVWRDFGSDDSDKGDLLNLWCATRQLTLAEALKEAKDYLGIVENDFLTAPKKKYRKPDKPKNAKALTPTSPVMKYLTEERKLTPETIKAYNIGECPEIGPWSGWKKQEPWKGPWIIFSYRNGEEVHSIKYLHLKRNKGKKITLVESNCMPTLFGWRTIPDDAREITLTEGEIDASSLHQYGHHALSVPFGGGGGDKQQWVEYEWENLERFEVIYIAMDTDEEGQLAAQELIKRLGIHRCKILKLPRKDANLCLQDGVTKEEIDKCYKESKFIDPEELKPASAFQHETEKEFYPDNDVILGVELPWQKIGKDKFMFRPAEWTLWTGVNGHGKSQNIGHCMVHAAYMGEKICIASLEQKPKKTLARNVRQIRGQRKPELTEIDKCFKWLGGKFWLFDLVGTAKAERLFEVFEYAYHRYGIKQFVIDSLMRCGIHEDDYNKQADFANQITDFVAKFNCHIHLVAHPRKKENESEARGKMDVKGTGTISDLAHNCCSVWRNKKKEKNLDIIRDGGTVKGVTEEDLLIEPDAQWICDKQREGEWEGFVNLWFQKDSFQYYDTPPAKSFNYLRDFIEHSEANGKDDHEDENLDEWA